MTLIQKIAQTLDAWNACQQTGNQEWLLRHEETLQKIEKNWLPNGSGFDAGTKINLDKSNSRKIVLETAFHHMHDSGYYGGWSEHTLTITPEFNGVSIKVSGSNRNDIKEYIAEYFYSVLALDYPE